MKPSTLSRNVLTYFAVSLVFLFGCGKESKTTEESLVPTETDADSLSNFTNVKLSGVYVTSVKTPHKNFDSGNLFDSRKEFAWAEGADGNGINESISIELKEKIELTALKIFNGYQRSEKHYKANTRLKSVTVSNEYSQTSNVVFQDTQGEQTAFLSTPLKGNVFKLTVQEVFAGSSYKDLVISELKLVSNDSDIIIEGTLTEGIKTRLLRKIEDTVLEQYVDRGMSNRPSGRDYYDYDPYDKSIILRSDYTFVAYNKSWNDDHSEELIADGNWEIKELNRDQAKIRVFGKLLRNSETIDYYAGNTATNQQQIFQDFLTITNYKVKGDKFIPEITNKIE